MKIFSLCLDSPKNTAGGLGVHVYEIYKRMVTDGHEVTVLGFDTKRDSETFFQCTAGVFKKSDKLSWKPIPDSFRYCNPPVTQDFITKDPILLKKFQDDAWLMSALRYVGKEDFDIIHIHDHHGYQAASKLRALWKIPIVLTVHLSSLLYRPDLAVTIADRFVLQEEITAFTGANSIIAVSEYYKKGLEESLDIDNVDVVYNGVDYELLRTKERYDFPEGRKVVTFVGRLLDTKGVPEILEVVKRMRGVHFNLIANIDLSLAERCPIVAEIERLKKRKNNNLFWFNHLNQEAKWKMMRGSNVAIMPSLHEPFGITALEWMSLDVPLIVSDTGGLKEFCLPENSNAVKAGDWRSLKKAIGKSKFDQTKVSNGRKMALSMNWESTVTKTLDVLKNAIGEYKG